jgi:hypothetical protein
MKYLYSLVTNDKLLQRCTNPHFKWCHTRNHILWRNIEQKREETRVANIHKSTRVEEIHLEALTSTDTGGARPYRAPIPPGTAFAWSNGATFVKMPIYFDTPAATQRAVILRLRKKHTPSKIHHFTATIVHHLHLIT